MKYKIVKINAKTEQEINYGGGYTADDVKAITKGYTLDQALKMIAAIKETYGERI